MPEKPLASTFARSAIDARTARTGSGVADAGGVTAQQVDLQRAERLPGDGGFGQRARTRVDAVDRRIAERLAIDDRARRIDAPGGVGREADWLVVVGDGEQLVEREAGAVEKDHRGGCGTREAGAVIEGRIQQS